MGISHLNHKNVTNPRGLSRVQNIDTSSKMGTLPLFNGL